VRAADDRVDLVPEPASAAPASPVAKAAPKVADAVPADATQLPTLRSVVGLVGDRLRSRRRG